MKKIFLFGLIVLFFVPVLVFSGQTIVIKVKVQVANVREEPDLNSSIVKQFPVGTLLEAQSKIQNWYEIVITDDAGNKVSAYINIAVVEVISGGQKVQKPESEVYKEPVRREVSSPAPERIVYGPAYTPGGLKVLGGLGLANITYSQDGSDDIGVDIDHYKKSKLGFLGGIGYESGSRFGFEIDLLYVQKGVRFEGSETGSTVSTGGSFDIKLKVNELSLPVLAKIKFMPGSTPYVIAGGEIAYILSSKIDYWAKDDATDEIYSGTEDLNDYDNMNKIDYGLVFGAGFELVSGPMPFFVEGRYHMGMANLFKNDAATSGSVGDTDWVRTNLLTLVLGVKF
jgi:hypothetical protein